MIKHLNRWEISKKLNNLGSKIYVKYFVGTKTTCMDDYMQPSLRNAPKYFILFFATNDFESDKTTESIVNTIIHLVMPMQNYQHE